MTVLDIPGTVPVQLIRQSDNTIDFVGGTAGAVFSNSTAAVAASLGFLIILASCNGTASTLKVVHAGGTITGTPTAGSAASLDLTADWYLGSDGGSGNFLDADTALWWLDDAEIDFTDADNIEQFWDTTNNLLRDPGTDGSNPVDGAGAPLICHRDHSSTHTVNVGSGGDADGGSNSGDGVSPGNYAGDFGVETALAVLANAVAWYEPRDASNVKADGNTTFSQLTDLSGNGNHLLQGTAANRPTVAAGGGLTWADFDGSDDFMLTSGATASLMNNANAGGTVIIIYHADAAPAFDRIWAKVDSGGSFTDENMVNEEVGAGDLNFSWGWVFTGTSRRFDSNPDFASWAGVRRLLGYRADKSDSGAGGAVCTVDGDDLTSGSGVVNINGGGFSGTPEDLSGGELRLSGIPGFSRNLDGGVYALAFWDTILSNTDFNAVRDYFATEFGVALS
jgi:hypothetical protein